MKYRVDFEYGYAIFDETQAETALQTYRDARAAGQAVRLRLCNGFGDEGVVIAGRPIFEDLTHHPWAAN